MALRDNAEIFRANTRARNNTPAGVGDSFVKAKGRPSKEVPDGFSEVFSDRTFASATLGHKCSHVRAFRAFLAVRNKIWIEANVNDLFEWGVSLADNDVSQQEIKNYIATNRQIQEWHGYFSMADMMQKWPILWAGLLRASKDVLRKQAPLIHKNTLMCLTNKLRQMCLLLMITGLRVGSLKNASNADYLKSKSGLPSIYIRALKFIPADFNRHVEINCTCSVDGTSAVNCLVHGPLGLVNFDEVKWDSWFSELSSLHITWHSCKRTVATYFRVAEIYFGIKLDLQRVCRFLGWSVAEAEHEENKKMFLYYTKDHERVNLEDLPDLYRLFLFFRE